MAVADEQGIALAGLRPGLRPRRVAWDRIAPLALSIVTLLIVGYFVVLPLATILISSLKPAGLPNTPGWTLEHLADVFGSADTYRLLGRTLVFACGSAMFAVLLGPSAAWLIRRTDLPARRWFEGILLAPLAVPKILFAMGWILLLAPRIGVFNTLTAPLTGSPEGLFRVYSMGGMIFVNGLSLSPMAFLLSAPAIQGLNTELEQAAAACGASAFQSFRRIVLPLLWPTIVAAFSYLLVLSVVLFDIPALIGLPARIFVLSTAIYDAAVPAKGFPDYGLISGLSLLTLTLSLILVLVYRRIIRAPNRFETLTGKARNAPHELGRWRSWAVGAMVVYCLLVTVLPLAAIVFASLQPYWSAIDYSSFARFTLNNYRRIFSNTSFLHSLRNSLEVGVGTATVVAILGLFVSWVVIRSRAPFKGAIDTLSALPNGMPGTIVGVSLVLFYLSWGRFIPIYGTVGILIAANATEFLAYATRLMNGSLLQIHSEQEEAAAVSGASRLSSIIRIVVPLVFPAIMSVWIWAFTVSLRSVSTALLLAGRDNRVYGVELWSYWTNGQYNIATAMGAFLVAVIVAIQVGVIRLQRRRQWRFE